MVGSALEFRSTTWCAPRGEEPARWRAEEASGGGEGTRGVDAGERARTAAARLVIRLEHGWGTLAARLL
ncbi:hypothetical protein ETD86_24015 [Nonomuraea turkmeniaca]|uniref:Uncharacterized protein n=1 Tax=Nonomuraea turkmeniaca TaxID=103838 RepID=A0A5S4FZ56_9ACTN|nr:hypothetical protein [Nonomuraea turkmeniaca]TMR16992.1 hypothetical protein ETD86_24015 [Nonomuraea turkmeniaca]